MSGMICFTNAAAAFTCDSPEGTPEIILDEGQEVEVFDSYSVKGTKMMCVQADVDGILYSAAVPYDIITPRVVGINA